jgi:hypothetical protein
MKIKMGQAMNKDRAARCYNLFRRKLEEDLYCAVPEDRPVPGFVAGEWEFAAGSRKPTRRRAASGSTPLRPRRGSAATMSSMPGGNSGRLTVT